MPIPFRRPLHGKAKKTRRCSTAARALRLPISIARDCEHARCLINRAALNANVFQHVVVERAQFDSEAPLRAGFAVAG